MERLHAKERRVLRPIIRLLVKETALTIRGLWKEKVFTSLSILLLALSIGFASAVFTLIWQAVYAQLPVPAPQEIYTFSTNVTHTGRSDSDAMSSQTFSAPAYRYLAEHFTIARGVVARHGQLVNMETPAGPQHLLADFVSGNFFSVLEVKPAIGQLIGNSHDVAVLSYDSWQEAYGGQASAWNTTLHINGAPFRVIGVAPAGFQGLVAGQNPKVYLPVSAFAVVNPGWHGDTDWNIRWLNAFVRLPREVSNRAAEAELQPVYKAAVRQELASEGPQPQDYLRELSHEHLSLIPASRGAHAMLDQWREPLRILQWMTLALLSLAAINIAGLMLFRGIRRRREMLIRYAVGAARHQVLRLHLNEILVLCLAGGLLGLWIARWGAELLVYLAHMNQKDAFSYSPHGWALVVHGVLVLGTALLAGILPAWQAAGIDVSAGLNDAALTHSASRSQALIRRTLAAAQLALSLALVISAGLFGQALRQLVSVPLGFDPAHLQVFSIDPFEEHAQDGRGVSRSAERASESLSCLAERSRALCAQQAQSTPEGTKMLWSNIARDLSRVPGVRNVTYGTGGPFPQGADVAVLIPGTSTAGSPKHQSGVRSMVGPGYFDTLGIPIVAGREFDDRDRTNTPGAVIINQTMAHKLFGDQNPLNRSVTLFNGLDPNWIATIVGVVADHHQSWRRATAPLLYTPAQQATAPAAITYYVRTNGRPLSEQTIREIVKREAPAISSYDVASMESRMAQFASSDRAMALLTSSFALFALVIAGVGIFGVVSYSSSLRRVEFGVRLSVGATPSSIVQLVLREAIVILLAGLTLGAPLTYFALTLTRHQFEGISLTQPAIYLAAVLLLSACALAAAAAPAVRARRLSVHDALRHL